MAPVRPGRKVKCAHEQRHRIQRHADVCFLLAPGVCVSIAVLISSSLTHRYRWPVTELYGSALDSSSHLALLPVIRFFWPSTTSPSALGAVQTCLFRRFHRHGIRNENGTLTVDAIARPENGIRTAAAAKGLRRGGAGKNPHNQLPNGRFFDSIHAATVAGSRRRRCRFW